MRAQSEQANSLHANGKEATTAPQDATAMAEEETIWRTRVWKKNRSLPAAQLLRVAEASAPCSPRSAKMVPLAATEP